MTTTTSTPVPVHVQSLASNCTEHTYLKRSWLLVQQAPQGRQRCRVGRLRHTFSSPEAFNADELHLQYPDFLSYGTNLPHERSSSNFGSELSRDPSSSSSLGKRARLAAAEQSECATLTPNSERECSVQTLQSELTQSQQELIATQSDSEAEQQVSCFGAVITQRPKRRRVRSRSLGGGGSGARRRQMQRSSSADLLIYAPMQSNGAGERLFFI